MIVWLMLVVRTVYGQTNPLSALLGGGTAGLGGAGGTGGTGGLNLGRVRPYCSVVHRVLFMQVAYYRALAARMPVALVAVVAA
jgi:hypothetical protein